MNNTTIGRKNTLEGINSRITKAEEQISNLEDRMVEITAMEQDKEKRNKKKNEEGLRDLWENIKHINIHIREVQEAEKKQKGPEKIFEEIIAENLPNMGKEIVN